MSSKHLSIGSECPALVNGKLRFYSMRFCPYAQRALLIASAKEIPFDVVNCNLKEKPEWLFTKNPEGKVPVLEMESPRGFLSESLIISDFLDDYYVDSGRRLQASTPLQKALDRILIEKFNSIIRLYYKIAYYAGAEDDIDLKNAFSKLSYELLIWETEIRKRGTKFLGGENAPGILDYMIWPWIERLPILQKVFPTMFNYDDTKKSIPNFARWEENMTNDEIVQRHYLSPEIHYAYAKSAKTGKPNYDLLEEKNLSLNSSL